MGLVEFLEWNGRKFYAKDFLPENFSKDDERNMYFRVTLPPFNRRAVDYKLVVGTETGWEEVRKLEYLHVPDNSLIGRWVECKNGEWNHTDEELLAPTDIKNL